jgi:hypothetical protein
METIPTTTRIGQAAAIALAAGLAVGAMAGPPHAAGEERPRSAAQNAPETAPRGSAPETHQPRAAGGSLHISRPSLDGPIRVRSYESMPVPSRTELPSAGRSFSHQLYTSPRGAVSPGRVYAGPTTSALPRSAGVARPIIRAPRTGPEIMSLPSGVDTMRRAGSHSWLANGASIGRSLPSRSTTPIGIRLPSGTDTARAHAANRAPSFDVRPPSAPAPAIRFDAAGAPAHIFGDSTGRPPGIISSNARDSGRGSRPGDWGRERGHDGRDDHHDRSDHSHHRSGHGSRGGFGIGFTYPYTCSYPTNYAYNLGGPWYTDLFPAGTWGYHTGLYAWQYDTSPIYTWDTSPTYSTAWCPDAWAWSDCLSPSSTTFVTGGTYTIPSLPVIGNAVVLGGVQSAPATPAPDANSVSAEQRRADARLLSRINPHYDALPDFDSAVQAAAVGDYTASIYAMRRAAGVNPAALMGAGTPVSTAIRVDQTVAQNARYARQVFENPPQGVVSEADAHFMVGALSAALGDNQTADAELGAAQAAGDISASTELLRRAVQGDNLDPNAVWTNP